MKVMSIGARALSGAKELQTLLDLVTASNAERSALAGEAGQGVSARASVVIVASELAGARERLLAAARAAETGRGDYQEHIDGLRAQHLAIIRELFPAPRQSAAITPLQIALGDLEDILHGVQLLQECSVRTLDLVLSFGVRASCLLVARFLESRGLTTRIVENPGVRLRLAAAGFDQRPGSAQEPRSVRQAKGALEREVVDYPGSLETIRDTFWSTQPESASAGAVPRGPGAVSVVAGGVAMGTGGAAVMLRRDGSDLTAALIAAAFQAELVELWTDGDGVTSADPEFVAGAFVLAEISYQEAMELSYFGARMVHPTALVPAMEAEIPIRIRNLAHPERPGTLICRRSENCGSETGRSAVTGIASIEPAALVNIEGGGMVGVPGIAARIFGALARAAVNIIMISQASSEHSICVVFRQEESLAALEALRGELAGEIQAKLIQRFDLKENLAILAVIGENMRGTPGISGRLFSALGREGVNILAIAQGSSETNISFVVDRAAESKALQVIHRAFLEQPAESGVTA